MPNPYEDLFSNNQDQPEKSKEEASFEDFDSADMQFPIDQTEPLDEVLNSVQNFHQKAVPFSKLLSETKAIDHRVSNNLTRFFLVVEDKNDQDTLAGERAYHALLTEKFRAILAPMKELAEIHLLTVKQFNRDIDKNYYSIEKEDHKVKAEKAQAVAGINLQRQILADAADDLQILEGALSATEKRLRKYIDIGGDNNISASEVAIIKSNRTPLTEGHLHHFNYAFFKINLIDKTAISLGVYLKETTSQYLGKLAMAFENRT